MGKNSKILPESSGLPNDKGVTPSTRRHDFGIFRIVFLAPRRFQMVDWPSTGPHHLAARQRPAGNNHLFRYES
jgi:hypothetical protein